MLKTTASLLCAMAALSVATPSHANSAIPLHLNTGAFQTTVAGQDSAEPAAPGFMTVQYRRDYYHRDYDHRDYHRRDWHRPYHHRHSVRIGPVVIR